MGKIWAVVWSAFIAVAGLSGAEVGAGAYRTDLPPDANGKARRTVEVTPLLAAGLDQPPPTSDWCSSLVWPMHSKFSQPMFPHPLAVQAYDNGLGISYVNTPVLSSHLKDGKVFQRNTSYRFPYRESLRVGLAGMKSEDTQVAGYSDWAVTARWQRGPDELRATVAHGSPFVYFERNGNRPLEITFSAAKVNRNSTPVEPAVVEWKQLTGKHSGKAASFQLAINAGKNVGIGSKVRFVYDFDGDGKTDRTETFHLFPSDPVPASWERYMSEKQVLDEALTHGAVQDFSNGSVRMEFWKCFGEGEVSVKLSDSLVTLPLAGDKAERPHGDLRSVGATSKGRGAATVFYRKANVLGLSLNNSHFAIFAPTGSEWGLQVGDTTNAVESELGGKAYCSVAVLPDAKAETVEWFAKHAFAFVRDTTVSYVYDAASSRVNTTFATGIEAMEGNQRETIFALYRHQHLHVPQDQLHPDYSYASPRGDMRLASGTGFTTSIPYLGILPTLPNDPADGEALRNTLKADYQTIVTRKRTFERDDTYWNGKEFGKFCELIHIAEQLGETSIRDGLLSLLKSRLADWFDGKSEFFFFYDKRWSTLTGYPDSYGSGEQLNDHHFHYSYFIKAAATIAQYDPEWVSETAYGGMIDLLIRDCANYDRKDKRFPWLRNLDPYAGHSWAAGHAAFGSGNNQESSSESMNFATALILYGEVTGNAVIRDLGIYWHSTEAEAIQHYWFDVDGKVFPEGYGHSCVGMVWGDGGTYGTWWTANPEEIHGINYLPLTGGSLYLGRDPSYVRRNFDNMMQSNAKFHEAGHPGPANAIDRWHDILHGYLALADPAAANRQHKALGVTPKSEFGETLTHTRQWLAALTRYGRFDASVTSDHPTALAFSKSGTKTYVVFNAGKHPRTVTFSDGMTVKATSGLTTHSP